MMIDSRKSRHQSHLERISIAKVNQKKFSLYFRIWRFETPIFLTICRQSFQRRKIPWIGTELNQSVRETGRSLLPHMLIYND